MISLQNAKNMTQDERWEYGFTLLTAYLKTHGDCNVPYNYETASGFKLGDWVSTQRKQKLKDALPSARRIKLGGLTGWAWNALDAKWEATFKRLEEYVSEYGDSLVPKEFKTKDGTNLGDWVSSQRKTKDSISASRKERLESLYGWAWDALEYKWELAFKELNQYAKKHGDCLVPVDFVAPDGLKLGGWVRTQRLAKTIVNPERKKRLEAMPGWAWHVLENQWEDGFEHLKEFKAEHTHCLVPSMYVARDGYPLGNWVHAQRQAENSMSETRKLKLKKLGGWIWNAQTNE